MANEVITDIWEVLEDDPNVAANLRARADLMIKISELIKSKSWTQAEAAKRCGITQPRINDLLKGKIGNFSLDALFNIATALGQRIKVDFEAA